MISKIKSKIKILKLKLNLERLYELEVISYLRSRLIFLSQIKR